jgi:hypothetical protein
MWIAQATAERAKTACTATKVVCAHAASLVAIGAGADWARVADGGRSWVAVAEKIHGGAHQFSRLGVIQPSGFRSECTFAACGRDAFLPKLSGIPKRCHGFGSAVISYRSRASVRDVTIGLEKTIRVARDK